MRFRFLYLGPSGSQIEVASLDDLRALIENGTIGEATPLFDALTQQWAPARLHAVFRLLCDETQIPRDPSAATTPATELPDLGLTVAAATPSEPDTDRDVRELMKEREREQEEGTQGTPPLRTERWASPAIFLNKNEDAGTRRGDSWSDPAIWIVPPKRGAGTAATPPATPTAAAPKRMPAIPPAKPAPPPAPSKAAPDARTAAPPATWASAPPPPAPRRGPPPMAPPPAAIPAPLPRRVRSVLNRPVRFDWLRDWGQTAFEAIGRLAEHHRAPGILVSTGVVGLLLVLVTAVRGSGPASVTAVAAGLSGPEVRGLVTRFAAAEDSGFRHMVAGIDSLRRSYNVTVVPSAWLEGKYLANASQYPEVKDYWLRNRSFLQAVMASDTALFRVGFAARLRDEGVEGPVLSLRLSQAMAGFEQTQPIRSSMYLNMAELTAAALALHDLLVERESDITYEPALDRRLSRDPVIEALPLDTLLRDRMWVLLDRIFASLERLGGGDLGANRDNLTEALLEGVEASQR
jgi:hypothetical protein